MGQKVNPVGLRIGVVRNWNFIWYDEKKNYRENLHEDLKIEKYVKKVHKSAAIAKVGIERLADKVNIHIYAGRPGVLIGKNGANHEVLKNDLQRLVSKKVFVYITDIKKSEKNAQLVAQQICQQLESRFPYRRAIKQAISAATRSGVKGIKIMISGRLNGAEIARREKYKEGRIPLHTLRADIDYGFEEALTSYGLTGVKVWIYNGDVLSKKENDEEDKYTVKRKTK